MLAACLLQGSLVPVYLFSHVPDMNDASEVFKVVIPIISCGLGVLSYTALPMAVRIASGNFLLCHHHSCEKSILTFYRNSSAI